MTVLRDILVPASLLRAPDEFGGTRYGDCLRGDLVINQGSAKRLNPVAPSTQPRLLIPALTEAHCHLDKCHSIARTGAVGGDLAAAIDAQTSDKTNWTPEDLRHRMTRGLDELRQVGCGTIRSHVDWSDEASPPIAWSVLREIAQSNADLRLQAAALTSIAQLADKEFCFDVAREVGATQRGVLGAFVLHHDKADIKHGLRHVFAAAERYCLPLDFHVDEGLGDYNGLEVICDAALETQFQGPILCGHAVSLIDRNPDDLARITDKLMRSNVHICALPTTNLYLQGRRDGTPDRRGLTRLRELQAAGVPIVVASDNVADAFCPVGQHDPRAALHLAVLSAHLDPPMGDWLPAITRNASSALGVDAHYIEDAPLTELRLCTATNTADFVAGRAPLSPIQLPQEATHK